MATPNDLTPLIASHHPLLVARIDDETRFFSLLREAATSAGVQVWTWSLTRGLAREGMEHQGGTTDLKHALSFIQQLSQPAVFVLLDVEPSLQDPAIVRWLKEFAMSERPGQTMILAGDALPVPEALDGSVLLWTMAPPDSDEALAFVRRVSRELSARGLAVSLEEADVGDLADAIRGLSFTEAEGIIVREAVADGALTQDDVDRVRQAKAELLAEDGVLELVATGDAGLDAIGGMGNLKGWLEVRGKGFEAGARDFGLDPPRGVLLTGVPGCGKSMMAKILAGAWDMPLVLLDPGAIYGSYLGESEARMRRALATVEAMAPVVLWIDEIEKGFATGEHVGDSGVSLRVLGSFLRWLQDRGHGVFLVATCNDINKLPPELLRRGRFDETFFVDLPTAEERRDVVELHLQRRRRDPGSFDLTAVVAATEGFSGAEIEGVVVAAMYRAYARGEPLSVEGLLAEGAVTTPLSRSRAEDITRMRAWSHGRAVPAGRPVASQP